MNKTWKHTLKTEDLANHKIPNILFTLQIWQPNINGVFYYYRYFVVGWTLWALTHKTCEKLKLVAHNSYYNCPTVL